MEYSVIIRKGRALQHGVLIEDFDLHFIAAVGISNPFDSDTLLRLVSDHEPIISFTICHNGKEHISIESTDSDHILPLRTAISVAYAGMKIHE